MDALAMRVRLLETGVPGDQRPPRMSTLFEVLLEEGGLDPAVRQASRPRFTHVPPILRADGSWTACPALDLIPGIEATRERRDDVGGG
jgi:hypothetical protein